MMVASNILGSLSLGKEMGLSFSEVSTDFTTLKKRQNELIAFMREGVRSTLKKNNVDIIEGEGKIAGKGKVAVNGKLLPYKGLIIASGGKWLKPDFPGADLAEVMNSDDLLGQKDVPKRVLLFGRSPWIIQIAQFLHRYGSQVILATAEKSLLPDESKVIKSRLTKALREQGVSVRNRTEIKHVKKTKKGLECVLIGKEEEETLVVDRIISFRREASLSGLGVDKVGLNETSGYIQVNERMETAVRGIYAIGDVASPEESHYSHLSSAGGIVAAENAMGMESVFNRRTICRVLFTRPQIACVGLTGKAAKQAGYDVVEGSAPLSMNPFGMIISQTEGIIEVVADKKYGEVLGMHFIGQGACEMAGQAVLAIQMEATLEELIRATFPHPTLSESVAEAARECLGRPIYLP
jgi:dihydrolipoamide dehydrogenase